MAARVPAVDAARLASARALQDILFRGAFVGSATDWHLADPALDARDRAFASAVVDGTLAYYPRIAYYLESAGRRPVDSLDRPVAAVLAAAVWQLYWSDSVPGHAAVDEAVELVRYFVGERAVAFANCVLRRLAAGEPPLPRRLKSLAFGLPAELYGVLKKSLGDETAAQIGAASLRFDPTTEIRLNRLKYESDEADGAEAVLAALSADGVEVRPGLLGAGGVRLLLAGRPLTELNSFRGGLFAVQGEASQLAVTVAGAKPGDRVLDLCAGAGGKSHALAAAMGGKGTIVAVDNAAGRVEAAAEEAERLGVSIVRRLVADAAVAIDGVEPGSFDLVFLDAPCSGLGLLAKKPEIRLRMTYERIVALAALQKTLLERAAGYVKPGGTLLYATCTLNAMENDEQIDAFLAGPAGRSFAASPFLSLLPERLRAHADGGRLTLLPHRDGVDGFFIARLRRLEAAPDRNGGSADA